MFKNERLLYLQEKGSESMSEWSKWFHQGNNKHIIVPWGYESLFHYWSECIKKKEVRA